MDFVLAILPICFLIYVMTRKKSWPSYISLPFAAALVYFVVLIRSRLDPGGHLTSDLARRLHLLG